MSALHKRTEHPAVTFLSSIRLAIFLLITLATASIVGTLIPQGEDMKFYLERYGSTFFKVIRALNLHDTYSAWWFVSLLVFFSLNLVVCTLKRIPNTLTLFRKDSLDAGFDRLARSTHKRLWELDKGAEDTAGAACSAFSAAAGRVRERDGVDGGRLYLAESGKWSHFGLYLLHSSILVIFAGAMVGIFFGFKAFLMLSEGEAADHVVARDTQEEIPLGFMVRCDKFTIDFYEDRKMPKEYRSDLVILEKDQEILKKSIVVNDPLSHAGITFYQSSYQAVPEITARIVSTDGKNHIFTVAAFGKTVWPEGQLTFGVLQYLPDVHGSPAARLFVSDEKGMMDAVWVVKGKENSLSIGGRDYKLSLMDASVKYMTGLQVKKDPGVWIVWLGCTALIIGFIVVFWVPHRRFWLWVGERNGRKVVLLAGQSNKNQIQFDKDFARVSDAIEKNLGVTK